jgi:uncharacterized protein
MGMKIRPLRITDLPRIEEMLRAAGAFTEEEVRVARDMLRDDLEHPVEASYPAFVCEVEGDVKGYICVGPTSLTRGTWHLYWICVQPDARGTGVAWALQAHVEAFVRARAGERLVLETSGRADYARARRFYERAGYRAVGRIADFYRPGDDCVIYCKLMNGALTRTLEVAESPGKGRGVFADQLIERNETIDESPVVIVPAVELEHVDRTVLENYYFQWGNDGALLLGKLSLCNHSYDPNAAFECLSSELKIRFVAVRDIQAGEEITINYNGEVADQTPLGAHYRIGG